MGVRISADAAPSFVRARLTGLTGTRWVGIDGKGASGKTTLAAAVAAELADAVVVHVDDFARPSVDTWERDRFVEQVLVPLRAGRPARYERWDWAADASAGWSEVPVGVPVVVEGVSSTDVRLGVPWDVTLWVDVPADVRLARALARDGETMREQWVARWMPAEDAYEAAQHPQDRVDAVVAGAAEQEEETMGEPDGWTVRAVGVVESDLTDLADAPRQPDEGAPPAVVRLRPAYAAALDGLAVGDRVVVVTWLQHADRRTLVVHPRNDPSRAPTGVFATRSEHRPNPVGLHEATVVALSGTAVGLDALEAVHGTPVLDLKPVLGAPGTR